LPLPWDTATAYLSLGDNEDAWKSSRGGGWAIKNTRCRKHGDLVVGKLEGGICMGPKDPGSLSYDPAWAQQPVITFSADLGDMALPPKRYPMCFAQLEVGCPNPPSNCIKKYLCHSMLNAAINIRGHGLLQWKYPPQA